jgi:protein TonB
VIGAAVRSGSILLAAILLLVSGSAQAQDSSAFAAWKQAVGAKIARGKIYPPKARKDRIEGFVIVRFTVDSSGAVTEKSVDKTSCSMELDQEALAAVQRAAPFPPIPADAQRSTVSFTLPIRFINGWPDPAGERLDSIRCPEVS